MEQLKKILATLTLRQKILILAAAAAVAVSLVAFTRWRRESDFRPLYTGLAADDAGAIVRKLRESGAEYRLGDDGTSVSVPSARVAELRLEMAGAGLPKTGRVGFELFDKTNFGVTDFAEHINYRRALEGELERSVMALAEVESARVHLTFPKDSVFLEAQQPAKASVLVRLRPGARLSPANVLAVEHLVASAVEGLSPDAVSVVDMNGNLLSRPHRAGPGSEDDASEGALEFRRQLEKDLVAKINTTLEPLLGAEKFRAGVSVDCDFTGGEQSEETFDPDRSVMTSSQKTEDISGVNLASGIPGTPSNLPRPASRPGAAGTGMTRRTENITYQTSRTVRRLRLPAGTLKRMSVAVLLDQDVRWEGFGKTAKRILEPPPPERIKAIHDLVAAAIGLDSNRGDQLIVETLPFESTLSVEPPAAAARPVPAPAGGIPVPGWLARLASRKDPLPLAAVSALLIALLVSGVKYLFRLKRKKRPAAMTPELPAGGGQAAIETGGVEAAGKELESKLAEQENAKRRLEIEALRALKLPAATTKKTEVLTKHLTEVAKKDPASAAQILRSWLYDVDR
jgi:flagellar M-ring protein FliF